MRCFTAAVVALAVCVGGGGGTRVHAQHSGFRPQTVTTGNSTDPEKRADLASRMALAGFVDAPTDDALLDGFILRTDRYIAVLKENLGPMEAELARYESGVVDAKAVDIRDAGGDGPVVFPSDADKKAAVDERRYNANEVRVHLDACLKDGALVYLQIGPPYAVGRVGVLGRHYDTDVTAIRRIGETVVLGVHRVESVAIHDVWRPDAVPGANIRLPYPFIVTGRGVYETPAGGSVTATVLHRINDIRLEDAVRKRREAIGRPPGSAATQPGPAANRDGETARPAADADAQAVRDVEMAERFAKIKKPGMAVEYLDKALARNPSPKVRERAEKLRETIAPASVRAK